ncbi:MAG: ribbon-helix-helix protein, CopG family [Marmoricola sp.]
MTDILIRNVSEDDLARIDEQAARLGLSRGEYLRRRIAQDAARSQVPVSVVDFERFTELGRDLLDEDVMRGAWS